MRTRLLLLVCLVVALFAGRAVGAQVIYPLTVTVAWDAPATADGVTKFTLTHNGVAVDVPVSVCSATECSKSIVVVSSALQTVSISSANMFGTSTPTTLSFTATAPGKSGNVRIRVP